MIWIYDTWDVIANSITSSRFIIIEKLTDHICVYCFHSPKFICPFNFWLTYEIFWFRLKKPETLVFHTFHYIAPFLLSVFELATSCNFVSHHSQYVAVRKLKCHCSKLHRIVKQIYIDKGNLHGQWAVGALSQVYKNLRIPFSETEKCNTAAYIQCRS